MRVGGPRFEQCEPRILLSTVSWDGQGGDFNWHNALNWTDDTLPGATNDVVIDVPENVTVTHSSGSTAIKSLLSAEALALTGGTLSVLETVRVDNSFTINGGTLADATVEPGSGGQGIAFANNAANTLRNVTSNADLSVLANHAKVQVRDGLTLNGTMRVGYRANVYSSTTQTWEGTGEVVIDTSSYSYMYVQAGTTLTIGPDLTVRGGTTYFSRNGSGTAELVNAGTIRSDVSGRTIYFNSITLTNTGQIEAAGGGRIDISIPWTSAGTFRSRA